MEGALHGITVNALASGYVDTPLVRGQISDLAKTRNIPEESALVEVNLVLPFLTFIKHGDGLSVFLIFPLNVYTSIKVETWCHYFPQILARSAISTKGISYFSCYNRFVYL